MDIDGQARAWASARELSPTPQVLRLAHRRIVAAGWLASIPALLHVPGIVLTRVYQHGAAHIDVGCAMGHIWVASADDAQTQRMAAAIHVAVREWHERTGTLLVVAVWRARWWHRLRAWWRWQVWRGLHR